MIDVNILRMEDVLLTGIEFTDDVCFSGNSGQEVFDKPIEDGGNLYLVFYMKDTIMGI